MSSLARLEYCFTTVSTKRGYYAYLKCSLLAFINCATQHDDLHHKHEGHLRWKLIFVFSAIIANSSLYGTLQELLAKLNLCLSSGPVTYDSDNMIRLRNIYDRYFDYPRQSLPFSPNTTLKSPSHHPSSQADHPPPSLSPALRPSKCRRHSRTPKVLEFPEPWSLVRILTQTLVHHLPPLLRHAGVLLPLCGQLIRMIYMVSANHAGRVTGGRTTVRSRTMIFATYMQTWDTKLCSLWFCMHSAAPMPSHSTSKSSFVMSSPDQFGIDRLDYRQMHFEYLMALCEMLCFRFCHGSKDSC